MVGVAAGAAVASANTAAATSSAYNAGVAAGSAGTQAATTTAYSAGVAAGSTSGYAAGVAAGTATGYTAGVAAATATPSPPVAVGAGYAMGGIYPTLPAGCISPKVQGDTYYLCGNTWFKPAFGANGVYYRVVPTP